MRGDQGVPRTSPSASGSPPPQGRLLPGARTSTSAPFYVAQAFTPGFTRIAQSKSCSPLQGGVSARSPAFMRSKHTSSCGWGCLRPRAQAEGSPRSPSAKECGMDRGFPQHQLRPHKIVFHKSRPLHPSRRDTVKIARRFNAGKTWFAHTSSPGGTTDSQSSRDAVHVTGELKGYDESARRTSHSENNDAKTTARDISHLHSMRVGCMQQ